MSDIGAQFAAALDRGTGPDDDYLYSFARRFHAGRIRHHLDPQELQRMFRSKGVTP